MRNDIRLFINDREIEFSADPKILLNYKETELHNPTVARNSYTKQITVEGTPGNNRVFDHIWSLECIQDNNFNPIRKTDFQLYVNDELFQKGYVKLDSIVRTSNTIQYKMTLYGGLGSFLYNLTYDQDDYGNNKKTLASLLYAQPGDSEPVLDFTINKDAVYDAWGQIAGFGNNYDDRWDVINFIPCLNGIPGDFDASKILINNKGLGGGFTSAITTGGTTYSAVLNGMANASGYSLAEMDEDLQEWQTRDLRSYNQRPCISMKRIIDACCNPDNNGGYQVKLDSHFFHRNNPYYNSAWVTLPMLKDLEGVGGGETYDITGATIGNHSTQYRADFYQVGFTSPAASLNNVRMNVSVRFTPDSSTSATNLYPHHNYESPGTTIHGSTYVRNGEWNSGVIMQMFALGQGGEVVGQSKAYLLSGTKYYAAGKDPMWVNFWNTDFNGDIGVQPDFEYIEGYFKKINGNYVFVNNNGQQTDIQFSFAAPTDFTSLVLKVKTPYAYSVKYGFSGSEYHAAPNASVQFCYTKQTTSTSGNHTYAEAQNADRVDGSYSYVITSFEGVATDYEGLFSGTKITKDRLLTTQNSPADYLLSYCKLFGLYFYYDSTEEADDTNLYPSGVVHIMDRDTFYTDDVIDLHEKIDWSRNMEITPAMAQAKWYKFDVEHNDSQLETGYKEQFGRDYGSQTVNTNYNFDNNTTNLYDGNVFKSGIMALEKDKYYKKTSTGLPVYQYNGLKYTLYHRGSSSEDFDTLELEYPVKTTIHMDQINPGYEFYNCFPMLQLHGDDNAPVDGENILVFFNSGIEAGADYYITDDLPEMVYLNDASPCWILTKSEVDANNQVIANKINYFPYFTRDLIFAGTYGSIANSWNFGHPQVIYSPDTYTTNGDSIYDKCWKDYISDLYSVDTRKLTCYVKADMDARPWPYWFRRFYWFENSFWMLNEIKDLNVGDFSTTKMEFIKVQDMDNYKLEKIEYQGSNSVVLEETTVPCTSGTVHGTVYLQAGGAWDAGNLQGTDGHGNYYEYDENVFTPVSGSGFSSNFSVAVPANTGDTSINWKVVIIPRGLGRTYNATFIQQTCDTGSTLEISPSLKTVYSPSGTTTFTISAIRVSNTAVTVSESWASASVNGNVVTVTYNHNTGNSVRTCSITVSGTGVDGSISSTAVLRQEAPGSVNVTTQNVVIDYNDTNAHSVGLTTNDEWYSYINDN